MIQDDDLISLFLITLASNLEEYDETIVSPESEGLGSPFVQWIGSQGVTDLKVKS